MSGGLDEIFQSIYSSVVEAQNTIESHYLGEIVEDYFEKDGSPKMIRVKMPGKEGKLQEIHVPAISLVPHQGILIDEVEVEMKVKLSGSEEEKDSKGQKQGKLKKINTDFSNRDGGKELATIRVKFKGSDPPEGLARIKDNLIKFIPA